MPAHCSQTVCALKTVRLCYASSRLRRCADGVAALAGERTGLHGLDALPGTRPWGAVSLRPLAALGQMAFYCALTSFERPSINASLEGHLPDRRPGPGNYRSPTNRSVLGHLAPDGAPCPRLPLKCTGRRGRQPATSAERPPSPFGCAPSSRTVIGGLDGLLSTLPFHEATETRRSNLF